MWISKEEAHKILDQAKIDPLVPYNLICKALVSTGDLHSIFRETDGALCGHGPESRYVRTRSLPSEATQERPDWFVQGSA